MEDNNLSTSTRFLRQDMKAPVNTWHFGIRIVSILAFIGSVGLSYDRNEQVYIGLLGFVILSVYVFAGHISAKHSHSARGRSDFESTSRSLCSAVFVGACINIVAEVASRKYLFLLVPHSAISTGYQALLVSLCPMPTFPGDVLYQQMPSRYRVMLLGTVMLLVGFGHVFGMILPLIFMFAEVLSAHSMERQNPTTSTHFLNAFLGLFGTLSVAVFFLRR